MGVHVSHSYPVHLVQIAAKVAAAAPQHVVESPSETPFLDNKR